MNYEKETCCGSIRDPWVLGVACCYCVHLSNFFAIKCQDWLLLGPALPASVRGRGSLQSPFLQAASLVRTPRHGPMPQTPVSFTHSS